MLKLLLGAYCMLLFYHYFIYKHPKNTILYVWQTVTKEKRKEPPKSKTITGYS